MGYKKWSHLNVRLQYVTPENIRQILSKQRNPRIQRVWKRLYFERTGERLNDDGSIVAHTSRTRRPRRRRQVASSNEEKEEVEAEEVKET